MKIPFALLVLAAATLHGQSNPDDGSLDPAFAPSSIQGNTVALQSDGRVLLPVRTGSRAGLARLNADGTTDATFPASPITGGTVSSADVLADDKMIVTGNFTAVGGVPASRLVRLNADGTLDPSFTAPAVGFQRPIVLNDGKILTVSGDPAARGLIRLNADGSVDDKFHADPSIAFNSSVPAALSNDGNIYVAYAPADGQTRLARLTEDGSIDPAFKFTAGDLANVGGLPQLASDERGGVLVYGSTVIGDNIDPANYTRFLRRFNADGSADTGFAAVTVGGPLRPGNNQKATISVVLAQPDGRILVGGDFADLNGTPAPGLARLLPDGTLDRSFGAGGNRFSGTGNSQPQVFSLALDQDRLLVTGVLGPLTEGSEGTGIGTARIFVGGPPIVIVGPASNAADLVGKVLGFKTKVSANNGKLKIKGAVVIRNDGQEKAKKADLGFFIAIGQTRGPNDEKLGLVSLQDLGFKRLKGAGGKTSPIPFNYKLSPRQAKQDAGRYVLIVIDPSNKIDEADESNNVIVAGKLP